jgi:hypothetical protein
LMSSENGMPKWFRVHYTTENAPMESWESVEEPLERATESGANGWSARATTGRWIDHFNKARDMTTR